jgi:hypothetical protein
VHDELLATVARDLRVEPDDLAFLARVDLVTLAHLHEALVDARTRQERALGEAFEGALVLVPRPVRGRVRKLLLGS